MMLEILELAREDGIRILEVDMTVEDMPKIIDFKYEKKERGDFRIGRPSHIKNGHANSPRRSRK
tara:strand:- start:980 stop:1171 length:192 start_codon:yes stop_codon:yes gene_type:complete